MTGAALDPQPTPARSGTSWVIAFIAVTALAVAVGALGSTLALAAGMSHPTGYATGGGNGNGMMGSGNGMMGSGNGMMGSGNGMMGGGPLPSAAPDQAGFTPGTAQNPRVIRIAAGPGLSFYPSSISVRRGETVTFVVTTMGPTTHEFMIGPADAVARDAEGTPELEGLAMMQTRSLTYTFDGSGPYAYACHAPGHDEAGMRGTITLLG